MRARPTRRDAQGNSGLSLVGRGRSEGGPPCRRSRCEPRLLRVPRGTQPNSCPPDEAPAEVLSPPSDHAGRNGVLVTQLTHLPTQEENMARQSRRARVYAIIVLIIGVVLIVAGGVTWYMVRDQLVAEKITVADDADFLAGDDVDGPFSAYAQADVINEHALEATNGKTYAELDREDPARRLPLHLGRRVRGRGDGGRPRHRDDPGRAGADVGREGLGP